MQHDHVLGISFYLSDLVCKTLNPLLGICTCSLAEDWSHHLQSKRVSLLKSVLLRSYVEKVMEYQAASFQVFYSEDQRCGGTLCPFQKHKGTLPCHFWLLACNSRRYPQLLLPLQRMIKHFFYTILVICESWIACMSLCWNNLDTWTSNLRGTGQGICEVAFIVTLCGILYTWKHSELQSQGSSSVLILRILSNKDDRIEPYRKGIQRCAHTWTCK